MNTASGKSRMCGRWLRQRQQLYEYNMKRSAATQRVSYIVHSLQVTTLASQYMSPATNESRTLPVYLMNMHHRQ